MRVQQVQAHASIVHGRRLAAACMLSLLAAGAHGQGATVELPESLFGHLDQHKTKCADQGCGPTSVVNSFVYLQTYYSRLSNLPKSPSPAPSIVTDTSEQGLIDLANRLGTLMGCDANCGTDNDKLYDGKKKYLDTSGRTGGWVSMVDWDNAVTWKWVTDTLADGVDVELLVSDGTLSHYVTLTGYTWNDTNGNGKVDDGEATVSIIDPGDGTASHHALKVDANGGMTLTDYDLDPNTAAVPPVTISDGFSEKLAPSPVPEPGSGLLLTAGALVIAWYRRSAKVAAAAR